jgi:hypothetical protein
MPGGRYVSPSTLLLLLSPFFFVVGVFAAVVIVALCRAKPEDVPAVWKESVAVFRRMVDQLPYARRMPTSRTGSGIDAAGEPGVVGEEAL